MFESTTLNLPELAARWDKTQRQILVHAASMALPLCFNFDGLVIDGRGQKIMQFDADHKQEHEKLTAFIHQSESRMSRRISGMLRDGESLTTPQAIELRKEITTAQEKIEAFEVLFDVVTRERQKYHYRGLLIATTETVDEINRLGFARHPIWAFSLDMKRVRLEPAATPWKDRLEPADMVVAVADVKAIEAAAKARQPAPASDTNPAQNTSAAPDEIDFTMVATRKNLIDAFGKFTGMDITWFKNLNDTPKLKAARKFVGQGGRHSAEPLFCPYEVMQWLVDPKRRKGKPLSDGTAWRLLRGNFEKVYNQYSIGDPNPD